MSDITPADALRERGRHQPAGDVPLPRGRGRRRGGREGALGLGDEAMSDPIPCGYCSGPIPESRPKWSTYCGEACGRAAAALRSLRNPGAPRRYRPSGSKPCESCGVGKTRYRRCTECVLAEQEAEAAHESDAELEAGHWVQRGGHRVWVAA